MKNIKGIIIISLIVAIFLGFFYFDLGRFLNFETLKESRNQLQDFYHNNILLTILIFASIYIVSTSISIPGATILTLSGGVIFGTYLGTFIIIISATIGATLALLFSRFFLQNYAQKKFKKQLLVINPKIDENAFSYLLFLRLVPIFPFFVINLVSGLTNVKVRTYFFASLIGMLPGSFVFCNAGSQIASINSQSEILSTRVIMAFVLLGFLSLIPIVHKKLKRKVAG